MRVFFLTDEPPFPPKDGRKVPVANYAWALERRGATVEIVVVQKGQAQVSARAKLREIWQRLRPYGSYYTREFLAAADMERIAQAGKAVLFVTPARLIGLAGQCLERNPQLKVVLLLNDAQWSQYWEALLYGVGLYPGGARHDLLKGLMTPNTLLREMSAYRCADTVVVQTNRELQRLPWLRRRCVVAPNGVTRPKDAWAGHKSHTFAIQVNFSNRRAGKLRPFITKDWPRIRAAYPDYQIELFGPGHHAPDWVSSEQNVRYVGLVDDLDLYLSDKRALLVPLEHATGISNTVLRGLAMDMPMVITKSSSLGVREMITPWPEDQVWIASNPKHFVAQTSQLLEATPTQTQPRQVGDWDANLSAILAHLNIEGHAALDDG